MTNIKNYLYTMRKRIKDEDLLKIEHIVNEEIERRSLNESRQSTRR